MSNPSSFGESVRAALCGGEPGVVGLVDQILALTGDHDLHLEWRDGNCRVRRVDAESEELIEVAMPKPAFRAALARLAALCNDRVPGSVTPYRGDGELSASGAVASVSFVNTPDEQWARLTLATRSKAPLIPSGTLTPTEAATARARSS